MRDTSRVPNRRNMIYVDAQSEITFLVHRYSSELRLTALTFDRMNDRTRTQVGDNIDQLFYVHNFDIDQ